MELKWREQEYLKASENQIQLYQMFKSSLSNDQNQLEMALQDMKQSRYYQQVKQLHRLTDAEREIDIACGLSPNRNNLHKKGGKELQIVGNSSQKPTQKVILQKHGGATGPGTGTGGTNKSFISDGGLESVTPLSMRGGKHVLNAVEGEGEKLGKLGREELGVGPTQLDFGLDGENMSVKGMGSECEINTQDDELTPGREKDVKLPYNLIGYAQYDNTLGKFDPNLEDTPANVIYIYIIYIDQGAE